jgi:hypothetical protein
MKLTSNTVMLSIALLTMLHVKSVLAQSNPTSTSEKPPESSNIVQTNTTAQSMSDWQRDNLTGSVRSIQLEFAEANMVNGKLVEIKRWPHQRVTYNETGT